VKVTTARGPRLGVLRRWSLSPSADRDFRGLSPRRSTDTEHTFGVTEQLIFPEIDYDRIDTVRAWTSRL